MHYILTQNIYFDQTGITAFGTHITTNYHITSKGAISNDNIYMCSTNSSKSINNVTLIKYRPSGMEYRYNIFE